MSTALKFPTASLTMPPTAYSCNSRTETLFEAYGSWQSTQCTVHRPQPSPQGWPQVALRDACSHFLNAPPVNGKTWLIVFLKSFYLYFDNAQEAILCVQSFVSAPHITYTPRALFALPAKCSYFRVQASHCLGVRLSRLFRVTNSILRLTLPLHI